MAYLYGKNETNSRAFIKLSKIYGLPRLSSNKERSSKVSLTKDSGLQSMPLKCTKE